MDTAVLACSLTAFCAASLADLDAAAAAVSRFFAAASDAAAAPATPTAATAAAGGTGTGGFSKFPAARSLFAALMEGSTVVASKSVASVLLSTALA